MSLFTRPGEPERPVNRLGAETSPYLLQHATNPVAWQPWEAAALARASAEDKPILLSIGYSACHWCHVMAHESFEDEATAAVMNRFFVNIKVDREERPDLDLIYQAAHQRLTGRPGGWPLTLFLTPAGVPFHGGTYYPPAPRHGLPGFAELCEWIEKVWRTRRPDIEAQNHALLAALMPPAPVPTGHDHANTPDAATVDRLRAILLGGHDHEHGGFGQAPKFPHPTDLAFLLRRTDPAARSAALLTLRRMALGGIHDQLGGGFCRYSVDDRWEIPHFEKMLYDNGQLLGLYADAWTQTRDALFQRVAVNLVDWLNREMRAPEGGFHSSLDADAEGEEGKYYVWNRGEIRALLSPPEAALAERHWGLDQAPNFAGRYWHLKVTPRTSDPASAAEDEDALIESARRKLFSARDKRVRPGRDDKILTSWNALTIEGLAHAARLFRRTDWLLLARQALAFLRTVHWRDGRLLATSRQGRAHLVAYLDDHAFLLAALIELLQADFQPDDLDFAIELAEALLAHFEDRDGGGFYFTRHDHEALIQRPKPADDLALPAGNGVAALALQRLGHLLGEVRYLEAARRTLAAFAPALNRFPGGNATLVRALEESIQPPAIVILRGPAAALQAWREQLDDLPEAIVLAIANTLDRLPPVLAKPATAHVNAWVCRGVNCLAPITDLAELRDILNSPDFR